MLNAPHTSLSWFRAKWPYIKRFHCRCIYYDILMILTYLIGCICNAVRMFDVRHLFLSGVPIQTSDHIFSVNQTSQRIINIIEYCLWCFTSCLCNYFWHFSAIWKCLPIFINIWTLLRKIEKVLWIFLKFVVYMLSSLWLTMLLKLSTVFIITLYTINAFLYIIMFFHSLDFQQPIY